MFILQDSTQTVPLASLALPDLDSHSLLLEHVPDFSVIASPSLPITPSLIHSRPATQVVLGLCLLSEGRPHPLGSWSWLRGPSLTL